MPILRFDDPILVAESERADTIAPGPCPAWCGDQDENHQQFHDASGNGLLRRGIPDDALVRFHTRVLSEFDSGGGPAVQAREVLYADDTTKLEQPYIYTYIDTSDHFTADQARAWGLRWAVVADDLDQITAA